MQACSCLGCTSGVQVGFQWSASCSLPRGRCNCLRPGGLSCFRARFCSTCTQSCILLLSIRQPVDICSCSRDGREREHASAHTCTWSKDSTAKRWLLCTCGQKTPQPNGPCYVPAMCLPAVHVGCADTHVWTAHPAPSMHTVGQAARCQPWCTPLDVR